MYSMFCNVNVFLHVCLKFNKTKIVLQNLFFVFYVKNLLFDHTKKHFLKRQNYFPVGLPYLPEENEN